MRISDWSSDVCSSDLPWWQRLQQVGDFGRVQCVQCAAHREQTTAGQPLTQQSHRSRGLLAFGHPVSRDLPTSLAEARECLLNFFCNESSRSATDEISPRSEERRVGKECVSTCRSRWSAYN